MGVLSGLLIPLFATLFATMRGSYNIGAAANLNTLVQGGRLEFDCLAKRMHESTHGRAQFGKRAVICKGILPDNETW